MRLTGEKSEVMYETRNTQKNKNKKVYIYISLSLAALYLFLAPYSVIALPFCPNSRSEKRATIPGEFSWRINEAQAWFTRGEIFLFLPDETRQVQLRAS
jgi:hypothetical protein